MVFSGLQVSLFFRNKQMRLIVQNSAAADRIRNISCEFGVSTSNIYPMENFCQTIVLKQKINIQEKNQHPQGMFQ